MINRSALFLLVLALTTGCAYLLRFREITWITRLDPIDYWEYQRERQLGRGLSPEESKIVRAQHVVGLQARIERYITARPYLGEEDQYRLRNAPVWVGMTKKDEIRVLMGEPVEIIRDVAQMAELAGQYWPDLREKVDEAWVYHGNPRLWEHHYTLYLRNNTLVAITASSWNLFL